MWKPACFRVRVLETVNWGEFHEALLDADESGCQADSGTIGSLSATPYTPALCDM